ncbi:MAG: TolC family protein [Candidatus Omnitrophota bacterium]
MFYLISAFFFFTPFISLRAEEISLTLDEAVSLALRDNRDILLKSEDVKIAQAKINEARAGLFPAFTVGGGWSDTRSLYAKDVSGFSSQAGAKQVIYSGGRVINSIKAGEYGYIAAEAALDKTRQEIILSVKKTFYTLFLSDKLLQLNKAIVDNTREHLDFIAARFSAGESSESEVIRMRFSLAGVAQSYEVSVSQLDSARALLNNLLFLDKETIIKAVGEFVYEPKEIAYDEAFLKALSTRPEIRLAEAQKNAAEKKIGIAKSAGRPQVYAAWDYYSNSHQAAGTTKNWNDYNLIGISVSWPIFDGKLAVSKVEQAIIDLKEAQLLKEKTQKDIALELKNAYFGLKDAAGKVKLAAEQIKVYKDNLSVMEEKYKAGIASELDLRDGQLSCAVALFSQSQSYYDYAIAKVEFEKATGGHS